MLSVKHLIDTYSLTADDITQILDTAASFESVNNRAIKKVPALRGRTIVNLFLEPSTRSPWVAAPPRWSRARASPTPSRPSPP